MSINPEMRIIGKSSVICPIQHVNSFMYRLELAVYQKEKAPTNDCIRS